MRDFAGRPIVVGDIISSIYDDNEIFVVIKLPKKEPEMAKRLAKKITALGEQRGNSAIFFCSFYEDEIKRHR